MSAKDYLGTNEVLEQHQHLRSANGAYYAYMQGDGNFVLYISSDPSPSNAIWSSKTCGVGTGPFRLVMQGDGNLVIYDSYDTATWASNTPKKGTKPHKLVLQNDRNLVLYAANGPTWATDTVKK